QFKDARRACLPHLSTSLTSLTSSPISLKGLEAFEPWFRQRIILFLLDPRKSALGDPRSAAPRPISSLSRHLRAELLGLDQFDLAGAADGVLEGTPLRAGGADLAFGAQCQEGDVGWVHAAPRRQGVDPPDRLFARL